MGPREGHLRQSTLSTGIQLASRGRRDMSSRVKDVVLSLALCHNVSLFFLPHPPHTIQYNPKLLPLNSLSPFFLGHTCRQRRWLRNLPSLLPRRSSHRQLDLLRRSHPHLPFPHPHLPPTTHRLTHDLLRRPLHLPLHIRIQTNGNRRPRHSHLRNHFPPKRRRRRHDQNRTAE